MLEVNQDYHRKAVDLSRFRSGDIQIIGLNSDAVLVRPPVQMIDNPGDTLVGAGTGNDVAAALRHGHRHVDAVELIR
jgi:hypothetical protein